MGIKTIILYARRQTGLVSLLYLVSKGHKVLLISDDPLVLWMASDLGVNLTQTEDLNILGFDLFICVHGDKIIPNKYLQVGKFVNVHPCLENGYLGKNPVKRYIDNEDTAASVSAHFMTEEVDKGEIIATEWFNTGKVQTYEQFYNMAMPAYLSLIKRTLEKLGI